MKHDCEGNHTGSDLHRKCLNFSHISSFESVIPVFNRNTKTMHANRFCAECSDIQDFEHFLHQFICSNALLDNWELLPLERTQENEIVLIKAELCVYFLEPPQTIANEGICFSANCLSRQSLQGGNYCAVCFDHSDSFSDIGQSGT